MLRFVFILSLFLSFSPLINAGTLTTSGQFFKDSAGATVFLRGVNLSGDHKVPPFQTVTEADIVKVKELGFNHIRLVFNWEAYEPNAGEYNQDYLNYIEGIVESAASKSITTLIDFHQDAYSRYLANGCGEGAPRWAIDPDLQVATPNNTLENCQFWALNGLFDPIMHIQWRYFYANRNGVLDHYTNMVKSVVKHFASQDAVIGYDLMNEPWGFDNELAAFYKKVGDAVLSEDSDALVFIEPRIFDILLRTNIAKPDLANLVFAPHFYDIIPFVTKFYALPLFMQEEMKHLAQKAQEWNVPLYLGEFGMHNDVFNVKAYMDDIYGQLNLYLASGAQWNYAANWTEAGKDGWNGENLSVVNDKLELMPTYEARPYVKRVAGEPTKIEISNDGLFVKLMWNHQPNLGKTVFHLPKSLYGMGEVKVTSSTQTCQRNTSEQELLCEGSTSGENTIEVRPCFFLFGVCL